MTSSREQPNNHKIDSKQRSQKSASEDLERLVQRQPELAPIVQRASYDLGSLTPSDVQQLQRTIGNRAVGQLFGEAKPHQPQQYQTNETNLADARQFGLEVGKRFQIHQKSDGSSGTTVQRANNIGGDDIWRNNHKGSIVLGSGSDTSEKLSVKTTDNISTKVMEKDLNHFLTGHTIQEFSFEKDNIERSPRSGFWPVTYGPTEVLKEAGGVIKSLAGEIKEAVGNDSSLNHRSYSHGNFSYVVTISTDVDTEGDIDEETGMYLSGTARLEQFYPISGTGFLYADKEDLLAVKQRLGK